MVNRRTISGRKVTAAAFAVLLLATGCGKIAEKATEKVAEKATGCKDIDVNQSGGSATCNGTGANVDANGKAKLPDGFPKELAPPSGSKVYSALSNKDADGNATYVVTASLDGSAKDVAARLKQQLGDAGYEITDDGLSEGSEGVGGSISAHNDTYEVRASFGQNATGKDDGGVYVTLSVRELTDDEKATTTTAAADDPGSDDTTETTEGSSDQGGDSSLPSGFPSDLAPPDGSKILASTSNTSNGVKSFYVVAAVRGTVQEIVDGIKAQLTGAGFEIVNDSVNDIGGSKSGVLSATSDTYTAAIVVSDALASGGAYDIPSGSVGVTFTLSGV